MLLIGVILPIIGEIIIQFLIPMIGWILGQNWTITLPHNFDGSTPEFWRVYVRLLLIVGTISGGICLLNDWIFDRRLRRAVQEEIGD